MNPTHLIHAPRYNLIIRFIWPSQKTFSKICDPEDGVALWKELNTSADDRHISILRRCSRKRAGVEQEPPFGGQPIGLIGSGNFYRFADGKRKTNLNTAA